MKYLFGKIFVLAQVLFFLALGLVGLLVPIIPGVLLLMLAAVIAARYIPALESRLNRNRYSAECLRLSNSFLNLDIWDKARLCFWSTLKVTLNGVAWTVRLFKRQFRRLLQT